MLKENKYVLCHYLFYIERAQCSFLYLCLNFFMGFMLLMGLYVV